MTISTDILCGVCGKVKAAHDELNHEFNPAGNLVPKQLPKPPAGLSGLDVPLRLLLLDKGIITVGELSAKEEELREQLAQNRRNATDPSLRKPPSGDHWDRA